MRLHIPSIGKPRLAFAKAEVAECLARSPRFHADPVWRALADGEGFEPS